MELRARIEQQARHAAAVFASHTLARTPLSPNAITIIGAVLTLGAVALIAQGSFLWAGVAVLVASLFDMLDGALARVTNRSSRFGAFLDSTLDRYSDALLMLGFLVFFQHHGGQTLALVLPFLAATGAMLTSYIRARAEALGFSCKVGLLERPGRIMLITLGLLSGLVLPMLWLLAVLTNITAFQRLYHVWRLDQAEPLTLRDS